MLLGKNRSRKLRNWESKEREAFQNGKQKLLESEFLTHYDLQRPVSVSCDASPYGVGACLTHIMPDGTERLEKEALALVYGVKQFRKYLVGREFKLVTDHLPLLKILDHM